MVALNMRTDLLQFQELLLHCLHICVVIDCLRLHLVSVSISLFVSCILLLLE